jgi:hypothetical protein
MRATLIIPIEKTIKPKYICRNILFDLGFRSRKYPKWVILDVYLVNIKVHNFEMHLYDIVYLTF